jgi:hypothetical protein
MPNTIVHYTFAKKQILDPSKEHLQATYLGAQGPDPFFFYGVLPLHKRDHSEEIRRLGGVTQHEDMALPYSRMIDFAKNSKDKEILFAYIDGLFMHYVVDRTCHPYVFYNTGFTDRPEDSKKVHDYYNFGHLTFEIILDWILGRREKTFANPAHYLACSKEELKAISIMWYAVNQEVQKVPYVQPDSFEKAVKDYRATLKMAWDPLAIKKPFFKKLVGPRSQAYGIIYPKSLKGFEGIDFLNEKHALWRMPAGEAKHDSVDDLLHESALLYGKLHALLAKEDKISDMQDALHSLSRGVNHEGIIPNSPKIYWKLIWPKGFLDDIIDHPQD